MKKIIPFLLIILGLFVLLFIGVAEVAGVCLLLGIVMILLEIWPEKWEANNRNKRNKDD